MKSCKTLNIRQVSAIPSRPTIQSTECPIPPAHCTALALQLYNTINHWCGLRLYSYYKTGLKPA